MARAPAAELTIGPIFFHWPADEKRDFYARIADEAPVDTVYLGEVVCLKRAPFFEPHLASVAERLRRAGKTAVLSTLAEAMTASERKMIALTCARDDVLVEANDSAALYHLRGKPHRIGPLFNCYNEEALAVLARGGATHVTLPPELPGTSLQVLGKSAQALNVSLEVQVFGRAPLALSARCYHARAHGRVKDNCQYVCEADADGLVLDTLDETPFLAVNGIQTLSHGCLNLMAELAELRRSGVGAFRLSPHSCDMVRAAQLFRAVLDGHRAAEEAAAELAQFGLAAPFVNGFYHRQPGHCWTPSPTGR